VKFHGAIEGGFRTGGIPVGEDGIVVRLNDAGGEGKGSQDILGERFGDMDRISSLNWTSRRRVQQSMAVY